MQDRHAKRGIRQRATTAVIAAVVAAGVAACAAEVERGEPAQPDPEVAAPSGGGASGTPGPSGAPEAHAPHFEPASLRLTALPPLPPRLPSNAEDTGRYNARKPKPDLPKVAPQPTAPAVFDAELSRRQHDYLARWHQQEAAMRGASAEAVEQARAALKTQVVGP